ncbi:MAG: excisionase [Anaerovoracaceae bacterium]|jgi:hypothetical protein|nr:excisionase [Anaerovoracaceae bacterium]
MADNSFENTIMQSIKIACLSSLREDGLISDRQYDELLDRISEMSSKAAEKQRDSKKAAGQDMEQQEKTRVYHVDGKECPIWEKSLLTMQEASIYFNMGYPKLSALTSDDDCEYVVWNGTRRLIKRERFAEFLDSQFSV